MKQIEVNYEIGQQVKIKVNGVVGKINGIWIDVGRTVYNVEWVSSDSSIHTKWFVKDEIEEVTKGTEYNYSGQNQK